MYFLFNDTTTTKIYTLSLHDALPISDEFSNEACQKMKESVKLIGGEFARKGARMRCYEEVRQYRAVSRAQDRKSTRLNSSHQIISYAVFCLKKKNEHVAEAAFVGVLS